MQINVQGYRLLQESWCNQSQSFSHWGIIFRLCTLNSSFPSLEAIIIISFLQNIRILHKLNHFSTCCQVRQKVSKLISIAIIADYQTALSPKDKAHMQHMPVSYGWTKIKRHSLKYSALRSR